MSNQPAVLGPDGVARPYIGGQALIEGVMMRSPHCFSAVVRRKSGALVVREMPMADLRRGKLAWPLVRGVAALVEALKLGSAALRFSAEQFEQDLEEDGEPQVAVRAAPGRARSRCLSLPIIALLTNAPEDFGKARAARARSEGDGKKRLLGRALRRVRDRHVRGLAAGLCGRREQRVRARAGRARRALSAADRRRQAHDLDRLHAA